MIREVAFFFFSLGVVGLSGVLIVLASEVMKNKH
jgi:hypothetical protein